ncbi:MAG: hypothetical protein WC508_02980 [Patescibacteria group bacterium]
MNTCEKCSMPIDDDTRCACQPTVCFHCCECDDECECGCKSK